MQRAYPLPARASSGTECVARSRAICRSRRGVDDQRVSDFDAVVMDPEDLRTRLARFDAEARERLHTATGPLCLVRVPAIVHEALYSFEDNATRD
jgi:hypothetical protein